MRLDGILVNETQLGDSLNQAVHQDRRGDFGLLLAMLVQDVRFQGAFPVETADTDKQAVLRRKFQLPEAMPLSSQYAQDTHTVRCAEAFQAEGLTASRLQHCLKPEPLNLQGEHPYGLQQALANAEPAARQPVSQPTPQQLSVAELIAQQRLQSQALVAA